MLYQFGRRKDLPIPPLEARLGAMERLVEELPAGPNKQFLDSWDYTTSTPPPRFVRDMRACFGSLKPESSPGMPYCTMFKTNEELLNTLPMDQLIQLAWERICSLKHAPAEVSAIEAIDYGMCDPVRVFVKNELHTMEKVQEGRFRLICSVSCIDQAIERWLCSGQNLTEISQYEDLPANPGLGLHDEGLDVLAGKLEALLPAVSSDVSGFDYQVPAWLLHDDARVRVALAGCHADSAYAKILHSRVSALAMSVLVLSDGRAFAQTIPGVQKSGSYNTSSTNTHMRLMLAYMSGSPAAQAMGDDCVEREATEPAFGQTLHGKDWYAIHFPLKGNKYETWSMCAELCSTGFTFLPSGDYVWHNKNWWKQICNLLQKKPANQEEEQILVAALVYNMRSEFTPPHFLFEDEERARVTLARWGWGSGKRPDGEEEERWYTRAFYTLIDHEDDPL